MTAVDTQPAEDSLDFTKRQPHRVNSDRETAHGCRCALVLPIVLILDV
jgi:hypothetical protein